MSSTRTSAPVDTLLDSQAPLFAFALSVLLCWVAVFLILTVFGCRHRASKILIPAGALLTLFSTFVSCCAGQ